MSRYARLTRLSNSDSASRSELCDSIAPVESQWNLVAWNVNHRHPTNRIHAPTLVHSLHISPKPSHPLLWDLSPSTCQTAFQTCECQDAQRSPLRTLAVVFCYISTPPPGACSDSPSRQQHVPSVFSVAEGFTTTYDSDDTRNPAVRAYRKDKLLTTTIFRNRR